MKKVDCRLTIQHFLIERIPMNLAKSTPQFDLDNFDRIFDCIKELRFIVLFIDQLTDEWQSVNQIIENLKPAFPDEDEDSIVFLIGYCGSSLVKQNICEMELQIFSADVSKYVYRRKQPVSE